MGHSSNATISNACDCRFAELLHNQTGARVLRVRDRTDHGAASNRNDLILDDVKANDGWCSIIVEVASHCVANHGLQLFHGFYLSKDGMAEGARFESPSGESCTGKIISLSFMSTIIFPGWQGTIAPRGTHWHGRTLHWFPVPVRFFRQLDTSASTETRA